MNKRQKKNALCLLWIFVAMFGTLALAGCGNDCLGCDLSCFDIGEDNRKAGYSSFSLCGQTVGCASLCSDGGKVIGCESDTNSKNGSYIGFVDIDESEDAGMAGLYCGNGCCAQRECFAGCIGCVPCISVSKEPIFADFVSGIELLDEANSYLEFVSCLEG